MGYTLYEAINQASFLLQNGKSDEALKIIESSLCSYPDNSELLVCRAKVNIFESSKYAPDGEFDSGYLFAGFRLLNEAKEDLNKVQKNEPENKIVSKMIAQTNSKISGIKKLAEGTNFEDLFK